MFVVLIDARFKWIEVMIAPSATSQNTIQKLRFRTPVTDILTWTQCFASLASVLSCTHPEQTSNLLAYLSTIMRCHKEFSGLGGVQYAAAFCQQVATTRDLNWGRVNSMHLMRCGVCLSNKPSSEQWFLHDEPQHNLRDKLMWEICLLY